MLFFLYNPEDVDFSTSTADDLPSASFPGEVNAEETADTDAFSVNNPFPNLHDFAEVLVVETITVTVTSSTSTTDDPLGTSGNGPLSICACGNQDCNCHANLMTSRAAGDRDDSATKPKFPLAAFFLAAQHASPWVVIPLSLMVAGLFRWAIGLWYYSGFDSPPVFGDFEAQRHWMEVTLHLPVAKWYFFDLQYWGLDYPPLTAYHSWLCGLIGSTINPSWFALDASRGLETEESKVFMRATVLVSEYLIYVPALVILARKLGRQGKLTVWESSVALMAILIQPATMLIDHGHFQFNTVMLGFALASISNMIEKRYRWSCIFFVAALGFKQMALYYAPVVFATLLGVSLRPRIRLARLLGIALTTIASFTALFAPLLISAYYNHWVSPQLDQELPPPPLFFFLVEKLPFDVKPGSALYPLMLHLTQVIHRVFPLARGVIEDKVANAWCTINTVVKLKQYPVSTLSKVSLVATFAAILPSCLVMLLNPQSSQLPYAFASCAWGFFLFSFQVHEKSVLLPLLPMTLLFASEDGLDSATHAWVGWANNLGMWTLFPLLKRDKLRVPYAVVSLLWTYLLKLPPTSLALYTTVSLDLSTYTELLHLGSYAAMLLWHVLEAFVPPPAGKPDLWVVLNCVIGACGFGICYLWCTWRLISNSGILESFPKLQKLASRLGI